MRERAIELLEQALKEIEALHPIPSADNPGDQSSRDYVAMTSTIEALSWLKPVE